MPSTVYNPDARLYIDHLQVSYGDVCVLHDICVQLKSGQIMALVGESGCGKSTLLRSVLHLPGQQDAIIGGHIYLDNLCLDTLPEKAMRQIRGNKIAMVLQNHDMSLSPTVTIGKQLQDTCRAHGFCDKLAAQEKIRRLFAQLHLQDADRILNSYSFELSGGMNQRICIAMAMILDPAFLLADEPSSALDVTVQAQLVHQFLQLRDTFGTGILIATHNMRLVQQLADFVGVLYGGVLVELGPRQDVLEHPLHPYTQSLTEAIPTLDGGPPTVLPGSPPSFAATQDACPFAGRCPLFTKSCLSHPPSCDRQASHWALCSRTGRRCASL